MQLPRGVPGGEGGDIQPLRRRVQIHTRGQVCVTSRSGRELNIEPAGEPVGVAPHPAEPCRDIRRFQLRHIPQAGESEPLPHAHEVGIFFARGRGGGRVQQFLDGVWEKELGGFGGRDD